MVRFTLWIDGSRERHRFVAAQSPIGEALFRHYGLRYDNYETVLVISGGRCLQKSEAVLSLLESLGPPWSWIGRIGALVAHAAAQRRLRVHCQEPLPDLGPRRRMPATTPGCRGEVSRMIDRLCDAAAPSPFDRDAA
ncbi:DCC1-like thiol-disulfide oxidoreductase family protein [Methylobacterium sp. C25]|uniref:DCC1-like thiol-disulfide oxidoreductase family protein n=1 Tax=Methylobacterium sp. C25 TaxID=2721622 RepID=UPI001F350E19|nr:DCC1-like thiol-disulfide oxidoreductase family protein [Methylobacterium sp. C25]